MSEKQVTELTSEEKQFVLFDIGDEEFGVNITEVKEIIKMEEITVIPNAESYIKGVINLRGGIIVVIDLAMKLAIPIQETSKNTRIVVLDIDKNFVGIIVNSATEVIRLSQKEIKAPPKMITKKINANYISGVGVIDERLLILLNIKKLFEKDNILTNV